MYIGMYTITDTLSNIWKHLFQI